MQASMICGVTTATILNRIVGKTKRNKIYARKCGNGYWLIDVKRSQLGLVPAQKSGKNKIKL